MVPFLMFVSTAQSATQDSPLMGGKVKNWITGETLVVNCTNPVTDQPCEKYNVLLVSFTKSNGKETYQVLGEVASDITYNDIKDRVLSSRGKLKSRQLIVREKLKRTSFLLTSVSKTKTTIHLNNKNFEILYNCLK